MNLQDISTSFKVYTSEDPLSHTPVKTPRTEKSRIDGSSGFMCRIIVLSLNSGFTVAYLSSPSPTPPPPPASPAPASASSPFFLRIHRRTDL
mmetsp:Transcript_46391/g.90630  ORF Transcript_46391/g.90630 Transcript_46391/m.90630 type:complete len:92 (-) Transcript_46391:346-621(-)